MVNACERVYTSTTILSKDLTAYELPSSFSVFSVQVKIRNFSRNAYTRNSLRKTEKTEKTEKPQLSPGNLATSATLTSARKSAD